MFDWPEQIQTSPASTSLNVRRVLALDGQRVRPAGGQRVERHLPFAVRAGRGRLALVLDGDRDLLAGIGPAPDAIFLIALEDHVIAEDGRQLHVGPRGGRETSQHRGECEAQSAAYTQPSHCNPNHNASIDSLKP